jgi:glycerol-3-phosphate O-acyltransferase
MLERWGSVGRLLSSLFFAAVFLPREAVETIRGAARTGTVVYVMRMRGTLDFLYLNYACLAHGLPLARFANGIRLHLWLPLRLLVRRWLGRVPHRDPQEVLGRLCRARRSAVVFLRRPPQLLPPPEFDGPYLRTLCELQGELDRPLMLVPVTVIWGRTPVRKVAGSSRLLDPLLGDMDEPRLLRRIWQVVRHARRSLAVVCEPLNLKDFLAAGRPAADAAAALDAELLARIEGERRVRIGPRRTHALELMWRILEAPAVKAAMQAQAARLRRSLWRVRLRAARDLRRLHAAMTPRGLRRLSWIVRQFWKRIFAGFEVDEAGAARLRRAGTEGPLLFLPTHRSHVDYLILSDLCIARDVAPPHIAAGNNLAFWPLSWLFRTAGAFFIGRESRADDLSRALEREYLRLLLKEGHNVEIFIEGTRTRAGRVLPPKLGFLAVVADLVAAGEVPPVQVVPTSIGYERVVELASLTHELSGGQKRPESVGGVIRASRALRSNYGYVNVQFGEPIDVRAFLGARGYAAADTPADTRRRAISALGFHSLAAAGRATAVTPTSLCAAALLAPGTPGVPRAQLVAALALLGAAARGAGARFVSGVGPDDQPLDDDGLERALGLLERDGAVGRRAGDATPFFVAEGPARVRLEYYKNQLLPHVLDAALAALVVHGAAGEPDLEIPSETLAERARTAAALARRHFVHHAGDTLAAVLPGAVAQLAALGLVAPAAGGVRRQAAARERLALLAGVVDGVVAADAAATEAAAELLAGGPLPRRQLERAVVEQLHRAHLTGQLARAESCHVVYVQAALAGLVRDGLLAEDGGTREVRLGAAGADALTARAHEVRALRGDRAA